MNGIMIDARDLPYLLPLLPQTHTPESISRILAQAQHLCKAKLSRAKIERLINSCRLPYEADILCRTFVAYPWRMGREDSALCFKRLAKIMLEDTEDFIVLVSAVITYADMIDQREIKEGQRCRMYVPRMENWIDDETWRSLSSGRMGTVSKTYERITNGNGSSKALPRTGLFD